MEYTSESVCTLNRYAAIFLGSLIISVLTFSVLPSAALGASNLNGKLNINTATTKELQQLPFIGADRARAITRYRRKNGPFTTPEDLLKVKDVGKKTLEAIRPYLIFSGRTTLQSRSSGSKKKISSMTVRRHLSTAPGQIRILPDEEYFNVLRHYIRDADERITMVMFIFKITKSPGNRAAMIMDELISAAKRGVQILLVLDKSDYDKKITQENNRVAKRLRKHNISVRFDTPDKTTHSKAVVIDERFVFLGSHNLTHSALSRNNEFSLLIDSRDLAWEVTRYIRRL
jgi:competence ComEA-like helix-hairpin-helix protein